MLRFEAAGTFALLAAVSVQAACVTPKDDLDSYETRTADSNFNGSTEDDAGFDASGAGFSNLNLVMACTSQLEPEVVDATYFTITATFHATDTSGNGTFDFTDTALVLNAGPTPPTNSSDTVGVPAVVNGSVVTNGKVAVNFGATNVPAPASPLGSEIDFSMTTLTILIQGGTLLCGNLGGVVTSPDSLTLNPAQNVCVFAPPGTGGTIPTFTQSQFNQCPPAGM
ncbi:MAG TPA: hypothetical protein VGL81_23185 [Polyangiaceae bacterium]|jgi:hypothetical protein